MSGSLYWQKVLTAPRLGTILENYSFSKVLEAFLVRLDTGTTLLEVILVLELVADNWHSLINLPDKENGSINHLAKVVNYFVRHENR